MQSIRLYRGKRQLMSIKLSLLNRRLQIHTSLSKIDIELVDHHLGLTILKSIAHTLQILQLYMIVFFFIVICFITSLTRVIMIVVVIGGLGLVETHDCLVGLLMLA